MQKDAFKPQGREISVVGMGGPMPMPGQNRMMAVAPAGPARQPVQAQGPLAVAPAGRGAAIGGQKEVPRGAQQVRMAMASPPPLDGSPIDRGGSFQPSQPALATAPAPAPGPEMGGGPAPEAPRPFLQRTSNGQSVFRVTMRCRMGDGSEYMSMHDAEFPAGAQPVHLDFAPLT